MVLTREVQTFRGLSYRLLSGDASITAQQRTQGEVVRQASTAVDLLVARHAELALAPQWHPAQAKVQDLLQAPADSTREALMDQGVAVVAQLSRLLHTLGDHSGMIFDSDDTCFLLVELGLERQLPLLEAMGKARARASAALLSPEARGAARPVLHELINRIHHRADDLRERLEALQQHGVVLPEGWPRAEQAARNFAQTLRQHFDAEHPPATAPSPAAFFQEASAAMNLLAQAQDDSWRLLEARLAERIASNSSRLQLALLALCLGGLLTTYLITVFVVSFSQGLQRLQDALSAYAAGNLATHATLEGDDEVAQLGQSAEQVAEKLSNIVSEMRSSAMRLGQTGEAVAASASALAERTDEQARHIVQTVGVVGELSGAVAANASACSQLDHTTAQLREQAQASGALMQETVQAMAELESSSRRASDMVGVIDGIAFQTNILALNAAVEAARAGEAGRGFAVVAAEVRSLAQRSATAAAEVRTLLQGSHQQVNQSAQRLGEAGRAIDGLVQGVHEVSSALQSIAQTSAQQSASLAGVAHSVGNLDALTRQNQDMVTDSTTAALELMDRAGTLANDVSAIQLRQGSADEARNLVERAHSLIQRKGLQTGMAEIRQDSAYVDRDLYIFITDNRGVYRLHAANPAREGHRVHEAPGIDGDAFVRDAWTAANSSHWVDYTILNPMTGLPQRKTSFVVALDGELVLGCGFYRHQLRDDSVMLSGEAAPGEGGIEMF
jgi:methyl-accepting chemotaxis protein